MGFARLLDGALQSVALSSVRFYRKHLSGLKGYRCAWGVASGKDTCSGVGLRAFRRAGFFKGFALLQRQFERCAIAAHERALHLCNAYDAADKGRYARLHPLARNGQGGFVDCDPGCDADCLSNGPGCDIFDMPKGGRGCFSGLLDAAMCCDWPFCDEDKKASRSQRREQRAETARARQQQRQKEREARRGARNAASGSQPGFD